MPIFGELEEFAADFYPYRWPITIGLVLVIGALGAVAYRLGWHRVVWRRRLAAALIAVPIAAVAAPVGWYTLSPLWERSYLEEPSPLAASAADETPLPSDALPAIPTAASVDAPTAVPPPAEPAFEPGVVRSGEFHGADDFHFGEGTALLIETAPGQYALRFEEFSVRNGPDLFVYLSPNPDGYAEGSLNLGELKATDGAFNYEVPPGTDVSRFQSAVVWCRDFAVLFASAPLR